MDPTVAKRREMLAEINSNPQPREALEQTYGQVWDTQQLGADFDVHEFRAPFVVVTRKSDGAQGSLLFQHQPRLYFAFEVYEG